MSESYYWAPVDAGAGRCTYAVIGTLRRYDPPDLLTELWTADDAAAGRCLRSEVGAGRRPPTETFETAPEPPEIPDQDQSPEMTGVDELPPEFVYERELRDYHRDRAAYRTKASGNLKALMDIGERRRLEQASKNIGADQITAKVLSRLTDQEHDAAIIRAFELAPMDCRQYLRQALGLTDELIAEMRAEQE